MHFRRYVFSKVLMDLLWCIHILPNPLCNQSSKPKRKSQFCGDLDSTPYTFSLGSKRCWIKILLEISILQSYRFSQYPLCMFFSQLFCLELRIFWRLKNRPYFHDIKYCEQKGTELATLIFVKSLFGTCIPRTTHTLPEILLSESYMK